MHAPLPSALRLPPAWTDERIEKLKQLWDQNLSCRQIAASFDWVFSRNAIIGKARRLSLTPRFTAKAGRPRMHPIDPVRRQRPPKQLHPKPVITAVDPFGFPTEPGGVPLLELKSGQCRWPLNGEGLAAMFCAAAVEQSQSYCGRHCAIGFRSPMSRSEQERVQRHYLGQKSTPYATNKHRLATVDDEAA